MKLEDRSEQYLKKIYPFKNIFEDGYLEEWFQTLSVEEKEITKAISMFDIYILLKPQLKDHSLGLKSIIEKFNIREIFLEIFPNTLQIDDRYIYTTWISVYFLHCTILFEVLEYRNVYFVNVIDNARTYGKGVICFNNRYFRRCISLHNLEIAKLSLTSFYEIIDNASKIKGSNDSRMETIESDNIVFFSERINFLLSVVRLTFIFLGIAADKIQTTIYSKVENKFQLLSESEYSDGDPIFALNYLSKIDFKSKSKDNVRYYVVLLY